MLILKEFKWSLKDVSNVSTFSTSSRTSTNPVHLTKFYVWVKGVSVNTNKKLTNCGTLKDYLGPAYLHLKIVFSFKYFGICLHQDSKPSLVPR